jgi:hypothetical protein
VKETTSTCMAPSKDWIKLNVDSTFVKELGDYCVGCVARDHKVH